MNEYICVGIAKLRVPLIGVNLLSKILHETALCSRCVFSAWFMLHSRGEKEPNWELSDRLGDYRSWLDIVDSDRFTVPHLGSVFQQIVLSVVLMSKNKFDINIININNRVIIDILGWARLVYVDGSARFSRPRRRPTLGSAWCKFG